MPQLRALFFLTNGYDTRYRNNIAPEETERTRRKAGAHRKTARNRGPADVEYRKVCNRLKARKQRENQRGESKAAIVQAQKVLGMAARGDEI